MLYYVFHTFSMSKLISKNDFRDNCGFGLIAHINGKKSHDILIKSINALESMTHRGAIGADGKTGDGCGILVDLDKNFFEEALFKEQSIKIKDEFAIGQIFLDHRIDSVLPKIKKILKNENLDLTAIRKVPVNKKILGKIALDCLPNIYQLFIQSTDATFYEEQYEISCWKNLRVHPSPTRTLVMELQNLKDKVSTSVLIIVQKNTIQALLSR